MMVDILKGERRRSWGGGVRGDGGWWWGCDCTADNWFTTQRTARRQTQPVQIIIPNMATSVINQARSAGGPPGQSKCIQLHEATMSGNGRPGTLPSVPENEALGLAGLWKQKSRRTPQQRNPIDPLNTRELAEWIYDRCAWHHWRTCDRAQWVIDRRPMILVSTTSNHRHGPTQRSCYKTRNVFLPRCFVLFPLLPSSWGEVHPDPGAILRV